MIPRFLERFDIDYFLVAMPYTLLDQEAIESGELALCEARGVSVVIGAVFASGVLATGTTEGAQYRYQPAPPEVIEKVRRIQSVCDDHAVPLGAAALQFTLGHPCVATVIPGANSPAQVAENVEGFAHDIPAAFWEQLQAEGLVHPEAPLPGRP